MFAVYILCQYQIEMLLFSGRIRPITVATIVNSEPPPHRRKRRNSIDIPCVPVPETEDAAHPSTLHHCVPSLHSPQDYQLLPNQQRSLPDS